MTDANYLVVNPPELRFRFELRKNIPITLTLQNPTGERVAFKVKTTSPKKYCVRPSSGIVEPNGSSSVQVIMQAQREAPPSFQECKDKFLVQCVPVGAGAREVEPEMFASPDVRQTKLRVVLQAPPKPPSPVPEGTEEPNSPASSAFQPMVSAAAASTGGGAGGAGGAAAEKQDIKRRLDLLEEAPGGAAPRAAGRKAAVRVGGYTVMHLFVVAVLAFIIGQITQVVLPRIFSS